jgi:MoaA/NifB/PqqE/SkfB family radical SAM enzyme
MITEKIETAEWKEQYNPFNSMKGLAYLQWYQAILDGKFLPPVEVSVDPVNDCQLNCFWCNGRDVKDRKTMMSNKHLLDLVVFFHKWGVKAICFAGGGEPTLHPALGEAFSISTLPTAIITNGLFLNQAQMESIAANASWVGISVDAANAETYLKCKKVDAFNKVMSNMRVMRELGCKELTFKFLIHPFNQYQIYDACRIAKAYGAHQIHIRPISFRNYKMIQEEYDIDMIDKQISDARNDIESSTFKIYNIRHKFNSKLHVKFPFSKCLATPIMPIFQADNTISLCIDRKSDKSLVLGHHEPVEAILEAWGSEKHKQVIESVNLSECPKCTMCAYNEIIEKVVMQDRMSWRFT